MAPPGDTRVIGYCAVFKVRGEAYARGLELSAGARGGLSKLDSTVLVDVSGSGAQRAGCAPEGRSLERR